MFTLKLDYDGRIPADFGARLDSVMRTLNSRVDWCLFRRTRRGYHCVIRCIGRATAVRVVAAQAVLGSDWRRESFNLRRIRLGTPDGVRLEDANVLYTRKISVPNFIRRS